MRMEAILLKLQYLLNRYSIIDIHFEKRKWNPVCQNIEILRKLWGLMSVGNRIGKDAYLKEATIFNHSGNKIKTGDNRI